jgi:hypothetical protein
LPRERHKAYRLTVDSPSDVATGASEEMFSILKSFPENLRRFVNIRLISEFLV